MHGWLTRRTKGTMFLPCWCQCEHELSMLLFWLFLQALIPCSGWRGFYMKTYQSTLKRFWSRSWNGTMFRRLWYLLKGLGSRWTGATRAKKIEQECLNKSVHPSVFQPAPQVAYIQALLWQEPLYLEGTTVAGASEIALSCKRSCDGCKWYVLDVQVGVGLFYGHLSQHFWVVP